VQAHLADVYGANVSRQTSPRSPTRVLEGMAEWQNRPLDPVYPVIFIDAINIKIGDLVGPGGVDKMSVDFVSSSKIGRSRRR
jgi:transposase-like protein